MTEAPNRKSQAGFTVKEFLRKLETLIQSRGATREGSVGYEGESILGNVNIVVRVIDKKKKRN